MSQRIALFSKNVVLPEGVVAATLLLEHGKIAAILREKLAATKELPVTNLGDSVIMPGLIDCHVHMNEPGRTEWEGFETGTLAAAAGGITSIVDMPLSSRPVTTTLKALKDKIEATAGKLMINCGFWGGIIPGNSAEVEPMIKAGVLGFKVFLTNSANEEFPKTSLKELEKSLPVLAKYNLPLLVHAELASKHDGLKVFENDSYSYKNYLQSRPKKWENDGVKAMIEMCRKYKVRTHIVHLSSADSLEMIREAKLEGLPLTAETCPHYLYFSAEHIHDGDTRFKCAPPIRDAANNALLWSGLIDGTLDFIATNHSPAPAELKELQTGNFMATQGGIASLQFSLPIVWSLAKRHKRSLEEITNWMSTAPAKFLGLPNKGVLREGADADLVIWSPSKNMKISPTIIKFRHKITPYEGEMVAGVVESTWIGGVKVYDRGAFASPTFGKVLLRQL